MTLLEVVNMLGELDETSDLLTIYAVEPWRPHSAAVAVAQPEDGNTSITFKTASGADASYFLEIFIAKDFLRDWRESGHRSSASPEEDCERLIRYALYDA